MSSKSVMKSPTLVAVEPTFVLAPFKLCRTCSRSAKTGLSTVRVKKVNFAPFCSVNGGVSSQLLIVAAPAPLRKSAAIYESTAPVCEKKTDLFPWNQLVVPTGWLLLAVAQLAGTKVVMSSKPSLRAHVAVGVEHGAGLAVILRQSGLPLTPPVVSLVGLLPSAFI